MTGSIIRKGYIDTADGQVHYRAAGVSGPSLVMLHQTASSSRMYESVMPALADHFTVWAFDTPGFGASFQPVEPPTTSTYARVLHEAIRATCPLGAHLVGHHTGAGIACEIAATWPTTVTSLLMIGSLALGPEERIRWRAGVKGSPPRQDGGHLLEIWDRVANIDSQPIAFPPNVVVRQRETVDNLLATRWHEAYLAVFDQDFEGLLKRVQCPITLASGPADVLFPYVTAALEARPDMKFIELPGGAYVFDDHPERMVREIMRMTDDSDSLQS